MHDWPLPWPLVGPRGGGRTQIHHWTVPADDQITRRHRRCILCGQLVPEASLYHVGVWLLPAQGLAVAYLLCTGCFRRTTREAELGALLVARYDGQNPVVK